jgi:Fic family protein
MDISKFTESRTGAIIPISVSAKGLLPVADRAFVPQPLPPACGFDVGLWPLLNDASRALGELDGVARNLENPGLFLKPLQRLESLTSSRLEGTFATAQELMLFELNPKEPTNSSDQSGAWQEVANYHLALTQGCSLFNELPVCLRVIKEIHKTLLSGVRGGSKNPGEFRTHQVHLGSNRRYIPPPPDEMLKCLYDLEAYLNDDSASLSPLVKCMVSHYQIEAIHPFSDGNGRVGRVLLSLMIYRWCNLTMPWLYMSQYFERHKDEYIDKMFNVSANGDWSAWIEFCLRGVIEQSKKGVSLCDDLRKLRKEMHGRVEHSRGGRIHPIIEGLFESPFVRVVDLAAKFDVRYMTAKADVSYLASIGILSDLPNMKVKTLYSPEIFRRAYMEDEGF